MPLLFVSFWFWRIWSIFGKVPQLQPPEQHTKESNHKHFFFVWKWNSITKAMKWSSWVGYFVTDRLRRQSKCFFNCSEPPIIVYEYTKTIGPSIFSFKNVTDSVDLFNNYICSSDCSCMTLIIINLYWPLYDEEKWLHIYHTVTYISAHQQLY